VYNRVIAEIGGEKLGRKKVVGIALLVIIAILISGLIACLLPGHDSVPTVKDGPQSESGPQIGSFFPIDKKNITIPALVLDPDPYDATVYKYKFDWAPEGVYYLVHVIGFRGDSFWIGIEDLYDDGKIDRYDEIITISSNGATITINFPHPESNLDKPFGSISLKGRFFGAGEITYKSVIYWLKKAETIIQLYKS